MKKEADLMKHICQRLSYLQLTGEVAWWARLHTLKVRTKYGTWIHGCPKGTPDILALINTPDGLTALFLELKSDSGTLRPEQMEFMKKYQSHKHITVMTIKEVQELDQWISLYTIDTTLEMKAWTPK